MISDATSWDRGGRTKWDAATGFRQDTGITGLAITSAVNGASLARRCGFASEAALSERQQIHMGFGGLIMRDV